MKKIILSAIVLFSIGNSFSQGNKYVITDVEDGVTYTTSNIEFTRGGGIRFEANAREIGGPNLMALLNARSFDKLAGMASFKIATGPKYISNFTSEDGYSGGRLTLVWCVNESNWPCALSIAKGKE